jgi:glycosyltransferase involved in cell wall biosynthesis
MGFRGRVEYLPNFVHAEDYEPNYTASERSVVYLGRLSREKGIATLIEAVRGLDLTLKIIGDGPLRAQIEAQLDAAGQENVRLLGHKAGDELSEEIRKCMFAVIPSEYFENNPRAVIEAFALGKPAVGSRIGGIPELIRDGETGYVHTMGDASDLRQKIAKLAADLPAIERFGRNARRLVETELSAGQHYGRLMQLYDSALSRG